ncbi:MAG: tetratricopeptide repeat protein [Candidatus Ventricola sp.]
MKSDLTCPVEITKVTVRREQIEGTKEHEQIVCLIEFFNLSQKMIDSLQMNIICFDKDGVRLGGRLVRAAATGEARAHFSGTFMPDRVDGAVRVDASVEKVWFKDGVIWRREERNVREYTPNNLPEGRELDRLRAVAGPDAAGYAREDDIVWMCVCGRANRTSDDACVRCERKREQVLADYSFAAIDSTVGQKERERQEKTQDTLRRSSEETVKEQSALRKKSRKRRRAMKAAVVLLAIAALLLALARWGVPYGASLYAQRLMDEGQLMKAKSVFAFIDAYWPDEFGAGQRADEAEDRMIERFIGANTEAALDEAMTRAKAHDSENAPALYEKALLARAQLAIDNKDTDKAEALLMSLPESEAAQEMLCALIYDIASAARDRVDYAAAIARFESLGDYSDAQEQARECTSDYGRQLMREGKYELAQEQLLKVADRSDVIALIRTCRYAIACDAQEKGDCITAAELFETLGVYEEAETRARLCRYTAGMAALGAGELDAAAEQLRLAGDYEDAQQRFADAATTLGYAALEREDYETAIAWLEQLPREGEVGDALNRAGYAYAGQLESAGRLEAAALEYASLGNYEDSAERAKAIEYELAQQEMAASPETAMERFEALGDYRDAPMKVKACRYQTALSLYDEGAYEEALAAFVLADDYEDAQTQIRRCRYAMAAEKMEAQAYEEAAALFEACGAYLDAEDCVMRARYAQAAAYEADGDYEAAAGAYAALGSYEDAKLSVTRCEDAWLKDAFSGARMDMELGDYASVIETLAPYWQSELPERYAEMEDMYVSACLQRAQALIEMGRPLDALPLLEQIKDLSKTAANRLDAYVYRIIGRWKDARGVEYIFRRDGTCSVAGWEGYFGGSGYDITMGSEPYPTKGAYSVVNLRNKTLTLKNLETKSTVRLSYVGEAEEGEQTSESVSEEE